MKPSPASADGGIASACSEAMLRRARSTRVRVRGERLGAGVELARRPAHHREVHLVALELADQRLAVAERQAQVDARVLLAETRQQARQEVLGGADHADHQRAAGEAPQPGDRRVGLAQRGEHPLGVDDQVLAHRGQRDRAPDPVEQRQADVGLELLQLHRNRRRGEVQLLGGPGDAGVPGDGDEDPQLAHAGVFHSVFSYLYVKKI